MLQKFLRWQPFSEVGLKVIAVIVIVFLLIAAISVVFRPMSLSSDVNQICPWQEGRDLQKREEQRRTEVEMRKLAKNEAAEIQQQKEKNWADEKARKEKEKVSYKKAWENRWGK